MASGIIWTTVRVPSVHTSRAINALLLKYRSVALRINLDPPAAGPEAQISIKGYPEDVISRVLEDSDIVILAIREEND